MSKFSKENFDKFKKVSNSKADVSSSKNNVSKYRKMFSNENKNLSNRNSTNSSFENGVDEKSQDNSRKKPNSKGKVAELANKAAEKAVSSGLQSYGVPAPIANFASKHIVKYGKKVIIFAGVGMLLILTIFFISIFGGFSNSIAPNIKPSTLASDEIPSKYLEAYQNASNATGVPWTILAAIGEYETKHGQISPYDTYIRASDAKTPYSIDKPGFKGAGAVKTKYVGNVYQCRGTKCGVSPVIGSKPEESKGPLLLYPSAIDKNTNPQDINQAILLLANLMAERADTLRSGLPLTYGSDAKTSAPFWSSVLTSLNDTLGDSKNISQDCSSLGNSSQIPQSIQAIFTCESQDKTLHIGLPEAISNPDGSANFTEVTKNKILSTLLNQAYSASYGFSKWDNSKCDNSSNVAGIFPLTLNQAKSYKIDRCDISQNIDTTAKIVIDAYSKPIAPSTSSLPFTPLTVGWVSITGILGSQSNLQNFELSGSPLNYQISNTCQNILSTWVNNLVTNYSSLLETPVDQQSGNSSYQSGVKKLLSEGLSYKNNKACLYNGKETSDKAFTAALANEIINIQNGLQENTSSASNDVLTLLRLSNLSNIFNNTPSENSQPNYGVDSLISQYSNSGLEVSYTLPDTLLSGAQSAFANAILAIAEEYGGIFEGDNGNTVPLGGFVGIAYERNNTLSGTINLSSWSDSFPKETFTCGNPNGYTDRAVVVTMWDNMCNAALQMNVHLQITSGYRTAGEDYALCQPAHNNCGVTLTNADKPNLPTYYGLSPHRMGLAVDNNVVNLQNLHFLHDIVGCYNDLTKNYQPFPSALDFITYANGNTAQCASGEIPIKRLNTFGFAVLCANDNASTGAITGESPASKDVILCPQEPVPTGAYDRENWHLQPGIPITAGKPLNNATQDLSPIHEFFPVAAWNDATKLADSVSGFNRSFKGFSATGDASIGLFGIPVNAKSISVYETFNGKTINTNDLINYLLDPKNNANLASEIYTLCGFNGFDNVQTVLGLKPGCDKSVAAKIATAPTLAYYNNLSSFLGSILDQVGKTYSISSNDTTGFTNISLINYGVTQNYPQYAELLSSLQGLDYSTLSFLTIDTNKNSGDIILFGKTNQITDVGILVDKKSGIYITVDKVNGVKLNEDLNSRKDIYTFLKIV